MDLKAVIAPELSWRLYSVPKLYQHLYRIFEPQQQVVRLVVVVQRWSEYQTTFLEI